MTSSPKTQDRPTGTLSSSVEERAGVRSRQSFAIRFAHALRQLDHTRTLFANLQHELEQCSHPVALYAPRKSDHALARDIIQATALHFSTTAQSITAKNRSGHRIIPRLVAMHLCYQHTELSSREVAIMFSLRSISHSSALNASRQIRDWSTNDPSLRHDIQAILANAGIIITVDNRPAHTAPITHLSDSLTTQGPTTAS